jgi:hypothetical protein
MKSKKPGKNTSSAEVTQISANGIWILVQGTEYFLSYDEHPWFKEARVSQALNLIMESTTHLRWPDLDVDLELDSLTKPGKYPLVYRNADALVAEKSIIGTKRH